MPPCGLQVLRLGVYELAFRGIPAYAVSDHVQVCKEAARPAASGLVNALLRGAAAARDAGTLPNPDVSNRQ